MKLVLVNGVGTLYTRDGMKGKPERKKTGLLKLDNILTHPNLAGQLRILAPDAGEYLGQPLLKAVGTHEHKIPTQAPWPRA